MQDKKECALLPPPLVVTAETYRSDNLPSGHCKDFSGMYNLCSDAKPDGWTIVSQRFQLTRDRACNAWSTCAQTVNTPTQVCYQFRMQGHDEECGHSGSTGIHLSMGVLDVVWQDVYMFPVESLIKLPGESALPSGNWGRYR